MKYILTGKTGVEMYLVEETIGQLMVIHFSGTILIFIRLDIISYNVLWLALQDFVLDYAIRRC